MGEDLGDDDLIGASVDGWKIVARLETGPISKFYKATGENRPAVALELIQAELVARHATLRQLFARENEIARRLLASTAVDSGHQAAASAAHLQLAVLDERAGDLDGARAGYEKALASGHDETMRAAREALRHLDA